MTLQISTLMLQWAAGGLLVCWVTTRRREVGLGYGWMLRIVYGVMAALGAWVAFTRPGTAARIEAWACVGVVAGAAVAFLVSYLRRGAGVRGQRNLRDARVARVAAMTGRETADGADGAGHNAANSENPDATVSAPEGHGREFPPVLDLIAPIVGFAGIFAAASADGGGYGLTLARLVVGAVFLGLVSDAMLLGHWYLTQPGLGREPIKQLVVLLMVVWPFEVVVYLLPPGMVQVFNGTVNDGYGGLLGWVWAVSAVTTLGLVIATWMALRERYYSAVMAATGLLYLAILTGFGMDLVPRAVLG